MRDLNTERQLAVLAVGLEVTAARAAEKATRQKKR